MDTETDEGLAEADVTRFDSFVRTKSGVRVSETRAGSS